MDIKTRREIKIIYYLNMKIMKIIVPIALFFALVAGTQGLTSVNADQKGSWAKPA